MPGVTFNFNQYAGREVRVQQSVKSHKFRSTGETISFNVVVPDANDPVIADLRAHCRAAGLRLFINGANMPNDVSDRSGRLNVRLEKAECGKWRIAPLVSFG